MVTSTGVKVWGSRTCVSHARVHSCLCTWQREYARGTDSKMMQTETRCVDKQVGNQANWERDTKLHSFENCDSERRTNKYFCFHRASYLCWPYFYQLYKCFRSRTTYKAQGPLAERLYRTWGWLNSGPELADHLLNCLLSSASEESLQGPR